MGDGRGGNIHELLHFKLSLESHQGPTKKSQKYFLGLVGVYTVSGVFYWFVRSTKSDGSTVTSL
jgi:hypothetical protein